MRYRILYTLVFLLCTFVEAYSQDDFTFGHFQNVNERDIYFSGVNTIMKPATGVENTLYDSLIFSTTKEKGKSWFVRKLLHEHFFVFKDDRFTVLIDPIFDFRVCEISKSQSNSANSLGYQNTRGILLQARLSSKLFLNTSFYENQSVLPHSVASFYSYAGNIPGYARVKKLNGFSEFDYANAYGSLSFLALKNLNFTLGYDRIFVGDGYRSAILSDFAAPSPYFKTSVKFGKFEYVNLVAGRSLIYGNVENSPNERAVASYNFLIYNPQNGWQFTFFDNSVVNYKDSLILNSIAQSLPYLRMFDPFYLKNTSVNLGVNLMYENEKIGILYAQAVYSHFRDFDNYGVKINLQAGYKNYSLFGVKNLFLLTEYNHVEAESQNYLQTLYSPINCNEFVAVCAYSLNRFKIMAKFNYSPNAKINLNPSYLGYSNNCIDFQIVYNVNESNRMQLFAGASMYGHKNANPEYYISAGFRTALRNNYYDF